MFTSFLLKYWFYSKSLMMLLISFLTTLMIFFHMEKSIFLFDINSFLETSLTFLLIIDLQSLVFTSTVSAVSSLIIIYSFFYLENETPYSLKKFLLTLLVFILSMFTLSFSGNLFWLMVGWDGLGISSFCLIIFYQNWKSLGSGMVTFLANRLGDTLIIMSIVWIVLNQSSNSWMFPKSILLITLLITLGAYSKSAQLPYLFWLPQAMAAPTPVSALVHSSTLVTAGIYLICRFQPTLGISKTSMFFFFISFITVMIAGTSSILEFDLKKVIALSTLCHISLMMMFSIMGESKLSLFHLMMHAFFKSLLFMVAGCIIHMNINSQDIRLISIPKTELSIFLPFFCSILSMMGFPFMSGFYSKEILLMKSSFCFPSMLMLIMFLTNSFFSCAYSIRLVKHLFFKQGKKILLSEASPFSTILISGSILSTFLGGLMISFLLPEEEGIQSPLIKILLLMFSILGIFTGMNNFTYKKRKITNSLTEMWKSDFLYKIFQKHFFLSSNFLMWTVDEKGLSKFFYHKIMNSSKILFKSISTAFLKEPFKMIKIFHFSLSISLIFLF